MVTKISKKELRRIKSLRKLRKSYFDGKLYWIAPDGKAYVCDTPGMMGAKEIDEHNRRIKEQLTSQTSLL